MRATDFHSPSASQDDPSGSGAVEKAWPPQMLYLNSWPSASQDDPSGPCADDQGLYTDGDLQDHWRAYIQSFPRREGKVMVEQLRNNTNHRIGIPLRRISQDLCVLPLLEGGPAFLDGEGRPKSSHQCGAGKLALECEMRNRGGMAHRYAKGLDRAHAMLDAWDDGKGSHDCQMKVVRVLNAKGNRVWQGSLEEYNERGLWPGESLSAAKASKRRARGFAKAQSSNMRNALTQQAEASSADPRARGAAAAAPQPDPPAAVAPQPDPPGRKVDLSSSSDGPSESSSTKRRRRNVFPVKDK